MSQKKSPKKGKKVVAHDQVTLLENNDFSPNIYSETPLQVPAREEAMPFGFKLPFKTIGEKLSSTQESWKKWEDHCKNIVKESKKLEEWIQFPSDIRAGWNKALKDGKLTSCGLFDAPFHVIEKAEDDIKLAKRLCGIKESPSGKHTDPGYVDDLKNQIAALQKKLANTEKEVANKAKQVNTLTEVIAFIRAETTKAALEGEGNLPDRHLFGDDI